MCNDKTQNGGETDIDCGGFACPACAASKKCVSGLDCLSKVCSSATNTCATATCSDGVKNGAETDTDCGGGTCNTCVAGKACKQASDCKSLYCAGGACQTPSCTDKKKNGAETDIDCGGGTCSACVDGKACAKASDCTSGVCTAGACQVPTCTDLVKNGAETDVDCGGGACSTCAGGKACKACTDCAGHVCTAAGTCATSLAPTCQDILTACPLSKDGSYIIDPTGGGTGDAFKAYCDMVSAGGGWTRCASIVYKADKSTALYGRVGQSIGGSTKDSYFGPSGTLKLKQQCFDMYSGEAGFMMKHDDLGTAVGGPYDYVYAWKVTANVDLKSTLKFTLVTGSGSSQLTDVKTTMLATPVKANEPLCLGWGDGVNTYQCYNSGKYSGTSRGLWMATSKPANAKQTWVEISDAHFDRLGIREKGKATKRDGVLDLYVR